MDNKKIDPNVYENFVDASTALMLEFYSAHHQEPLSALPEADREFPAHLDALCRKDIRTSFARHQRQKVLRSTMKVAAGVLCALLVTIGLASTLILSVDAIREPLFNYYVTRTDKYVQISSQAHPDISSFDYLNPENLLQDLLPKEFKQIVSNTGPSHMTSIYENSNIQTIYAGVVTIGESRYDSENAQVCEMITFGEREGLLIIKNDVISLVWINADQTVECYIFSNALTKEQVISLASILADRVDKAHLVFPFE